MYLKDSQSVLIICCLFYRSSGLKIRAAELLKLDIVQKDKEAKSNNVKMECGIVSVSQNSTNTQFLSKMTTIIKKTF